MTHDDSETAVVVAKSGEHVAALDGMRGIAILLVMLTHAVRGPYLEGGSIGVDIFFVLSGFLITYLLVREHDRCGQISVWRFYVRRALRLGPALALILVVLTIFGFVFFDAEDARSNLVDAVITLLYAVNWARAFDIHPPELLGHAWSLSIEEQFYAIWPLLLIAMLRRFPTRKHITFVILLGALASWLWRVWLTFEGATAQRIYNGTDTRADSLLVGCALGVVVASGLIRDDIKPVLASRLRFVAPLTVAVIASTVLFSNWQAPHAYYWLFTLIEVLVALTILQVFVSGQCVTSSVLSTRPLVWVGTISYGLYLWHRPIYSVLHGLGMTFKGIIAGTLLAFMIAAASFYWVERPVLNLKKKFTRARLDAVGQKTIRLREGATPAPRPTASS